MKKKIFITTSVIIVIFFSLYLNINSQIGKNEKNNIFNFLSNFFTYQQKVKIRDFVFSHKNQNLLKKEIKELNFYKSQLLENTKIIEDDVKKNLISINYSLLTEGKLKLIDNDYKFKKFSTNKIISGIWTDTGGSTYIDNHKNKIIIGSAKGIFGYTSIENYLKNDFELNIFKSNFGDIVNYDKFYQNNDLSIKDIMVHNDKVYVSYVNEHRDDCYNLNIIRADINYDFLYFENFYSPSECIDKNNSYGEFKSVQAGGRIVIKNDNILFFSIGEFRFRDKAQDKNSIFGKILEINLLNKQTKLASIGHRNVQGLKYLKEDKILISTEHGPKGGDEININNLNRTDNKLKNFGWPISSYGEHYNGKNNDEKYLKAPLHKSHINYGFAEPEVYFVPSIGISELEILDKNFFKDQKKDILLASSLKAKKIIFYSIQENNKLNFLNEINIGERIRDLKFLKDENILILTLENSSSILFIY